MSTNTGIEWTDATWNPVAGCNDVSEGCRHCYARGMAKRLEAMGQAKYTGLTVLQGSKTVWTGKISFDEKMLLDPLKWKRPRRIFVNSMSDLFHENVSDEMLDQIFAVMALCPQHTFQVLTKRPARMLAYLTDNNPRYTARRIFDVHDALGKKYTFDCDVYWPLPNVQLGVSVENQKAADERIPLLLQTPAAVRFISAEPLLGAVSLAEGVRPSGRGTFDALVQQTLDGRSSSHLDWVICGGESGPGARPMHPDWARGLRDQCVAAGVPFFFKQWGEWADVSAAPYEGARTQQEHIFKADGHVLGVGVNGNGMVEPGWRPAGASWMRRIGKKAAGALLDGREWREMPA